MRHASAKAYLVWLTAVSFYCYQFILRVSPGIIIHDLMSTFAINATAIGIMAAFYMNTYSLLQIPVGIMMDRWGVRRILLISLSFLLFGNYLFAQSNTLMELYIGRLFIGAGSASAFIGSSCLVRQWFPPHQHNLMLSLTMTFSTLGALNGGLPLAWLVDRVGWRQALIYISLLGLIILMGIIVFVKDNPQGNLFDRSLSTSNTLWQDFKKVLGTSQLWLLSFTALGMFLPLSVFADLWGVNFIMKSIHVSKREAAGISSLMYFGLCMGAPCASGITHLLGSRRKTLIINTVVMIVTLCGVLYWPNLTAWAMSSLIFILGFGIGSEVLCFAYIYDIVEPRITGLSIGFVNSITMLGGALFQSLVGKFLDMQWSGGKIDNIYDYSLQNYRLALSVLLMALIVSLSCVIFVKDHKNEASGLPVIK